MNRLEITDNLIKLYEGENLIYTYNWENLKDIWDYATLDDVEGISAGYSKGLLSLILTTADGQGGIVAIVDTETNELVHYHEGSFAIKVLIAGDKLITLYHVICYGTVPFYYVDCTPFDNLEMNESDNIIKLPENVEFDDENIVLTLAGEKLTIDDGDNNMDVDISSLIL